MEVLVLSSFVKLGFQTSSILFSLHETYGDMADGFVRAQSPMISYPKPSSSNRSTTPKSVEGHYPYWILSVSLAPVQ
jgi:hypothetical protein